MSALSLVDGSTFSLARYDAMCVAIAACREVDEVKDWRDKTRALEVYYRQSRNLEAERSASEIRIRAERRSGELLAELARATPSQAGKHGGHAKAGTSNDATRQPTPYAETLERVGITRQTAHRYEALAAVPSEVFEEHLRDPVKRPTTTAIIEQARNATPPRMPDDSLWLWGRMRDLERDGFFDKCATDLVEPLTDNMLADVLRLCPRVIEFFGALEEAAHERQDA